MAVALAVGAVLLATQGPDGTRAGKAEASPEIALTGPSHPSAPVKDVLRDAKVRPGLRRPLRARLRASARPVTLPKLGNTPPPWAKDRRSPGTDRLARRVNPVRSGPLASIAAVDRIVSDEFNSPTLDTSVWTFVNPLGDVGLSMTGTHAELSMAAGVRHDLWTNTDEVPRLIQAAPNTDFEVEVNWDSPPTEGFHLQGILVQQDADDMLRIEIHHDGGGPKLFVARLAGGSASVLHYGSLSGAAPTYMRLQREGSFWTLRTSADGNSWTTAATFGNTITVNAIGPFAGNSSGGWAPPAYTSRIDYFRALSSVQVDDTPPVISGISATPSGVGAEIRWQTDEPATSSVAYGTDTSYTGGTAGQQSQVTNHAVTLSGLACGQLYHYQVRSRDPQANETVSADRTFITEPCPVTIVSDEFDGPSLNENVWTFVDPIGDVDLSFTGSQAQLSLPQGRRHDLWSNSDEVPKLLQAAPNTNFEVEAKWDTAPTDGYHLQGIIVQQDADDMLRIETHHDGGSQRLFVARVAAGEASVVRNTSFQGPAPVYFRLKRQGNFWTLRTSHDGDSWTTSATFTEALTVSAIGPFAGNSGWTPPSFTSRIDYFRDVPPDLTPPVASAIDSDPTGAAARVTWSTNEPATSEIRYGRTTAYEAGTVTRPDLVRQHSVSVHGLACDTLYHFQIRGADAAGNHGSSPDRTFTTAPCPLFVRSDEFNGGTLDGKWTFVDPVGDTSVQLSGGAARFSLPAGSRHDLWTGADEVPRLLQAAPDDDFEVEAKFDTQVTTAYQMQGLVVEQDTDDLLRIETHHDGGHAYLFVASIADGVASPIVARRIPASPSFWLRVSRVGDRWTVRFSHDGDGYSLGASFDRAMTVTAVGPYAGNSGSTPPAFQSRIDYFREITDRTPPVISDLQLTPGANSVVLTWTTDEPASSVVAHGPTTSYGQVASSSKLETRHWIRATGLSCGTAYHLQARSADQLGNQVSSTDRTFTTAPCGGGGGPEIDVWGGANQTFGQLGMPQRWINVRGNVYDPQGTASLRATLNGVHPQNLTIGPDNNRLERQGDFNVELNRDLLLPGPNQVEITAVDNAGNSTARTVTVDWRGLSAGGTPPANGPVLVVVAHGDDALLGMAGIIRRAKLQGRRVYVAAATNGDEPQTGDVSGYCGAADGSGAATAQRGLTLSRETMTAVGLLGLQYSTNLSQTELIFLGYPNDGLVPIVQQNGAPWLGGGSGLGRTYGEDDDGSNATCNGELRYLLTGHHSPLTSTALAADFDSLLQQTAPSDIYTLADFDGHPDHAEVSRQTTASVRRLGLTTRVHTTVVHPHESGPCMGFSAANWPNPARVDDDPLSRFTPTIEFLSPPVPTCSEPSGLFSWGPLGPPTQSVEVPAEMQATNPQDNLKWRTLNVWDSQCPPDNPAHVTCGYFNAFAKKNEFFWNWVYSGQTSWPVSYTADWDSTSTIPDKAQVVEGEWTYDSARDGVRPLAPGFDRLLALGNFDWRSYEVEVPVTLHWFDSTKGSAGIGVVLGWQGHTDYGGLQPRLGHPYGGICGFGRSSSEPALPRLELVRNSGSVEDTIMAAENPARAITLGAEYTMRFRRVDLGNGSSRYSCKLWRSSAAEPSGWDLEVDLPDQLATSPQFRGSALLMAHNVDATFGDARVVPLN